jgi:hypothetical protein
MKRLLTVLVVSLVLGLVGGVGPAWADLVPPPSDGAGSPLQSATQSNQGTNTANQSALSAPVVSSGPNIAIANGLGGGDKKSSCNPCDGGGGGAVTQNSGNNVDASTENTAKQTNNQSNGAGQSQTAGQDGKSAGAEQSANQSNNGTNTANQNATSAPVVVSGPNIAILNSGDVNQNSGNNVDASTENNAKQTNNQSNGAGQSQTGESKDGKKGCCSSEQGSGGATQSAKQSNEGTNTANQRATSTPVVISGGNVAILNKGDVHQNSGNNVDASAENNADQTNNQSNGAGQSQTVGKDGHKGCCSKDEGSGGSQSATQSNWGKNEANQNALSAPFVASGPNIAIANGWGHDKCNPCGGDSGTVSQNSGNNVDASTENTARQTNNQSNGLGQNQWVEGAGKGCCSKDGGATQSATQSNWGGNTANQNALSAPIVASGPNVAFANFGDVHQNSGNNVDASAENEAKQTNNQRNGLGQSQWVENGGRGCCSKDAVTQTASQCNSAKNEANQNALSAPVVTSSPNVAFLNFGDVSQNSGNNVDASAENTAHQTNNQSNGLGQTQHVSGQDGRDCKPECERKPQDCEPKPPKDCEPKPPRDCEPKPPKDCEPKPPKDCEPKPPKDCEPKPKQCEPKRCEPKPKQCDGQSARSSNGRVS